MYRLCCKAYAGKKYLQDRFVKFIVDAQLPQSLATLLKPKGADALHTLELPDKNRTEDRAIIKLAFEEGEL